MYSISAEVTSVASFPLIWLKRLHLPFSKGNWISKVIAIEVTYTWFEIINRVKSILLAQFRI